MKNIVYFIEDDPELINLMKMKLNDNITTIRCFENFHEALECLKNAKVDEFPKVIFSDFMLPKGDGVDFLMDLRKFYSNKVLPFYFLTAVNRNLIEALVEKKNYESILNKPIKFEEIFSILKLITG